ncbi:MAG: hypothetical protein V7784_24240, partial [Oceanospirillaceae bacterium]
GSAVAKEITIKIPEAREKIEYSLNAGDTVIFPSSDADLSIDTQTSSLVLEYQNGGIVILKGFNDQLYGAKEILLHMHDGMEISATNLFNLLIAEQEVGSATEVAAGAAAGGGELFGFFRIASWLLKRSSFVSDVGAAETSLSSVDKLPVLQQLLMQMEIHKSYMIRDHARQLLQKTDALLLTMKDIVNRGGAGTTDLKFVEGAKLKAELTLMDAEYALTLGVDAHQDAYQQRLQKSAFPKWSDKIPETLKEINQSLTNNIAADRARLMFRQTKHAEKTISLLNVLIKLSMDILTDIENQFSIGQRPVSAVLSVLQTQYDVRVNHVGRRYELAQAEAWLQAANGKLDKKYILQPGWQ